jgi:hypothetical protein
MDSAARIQPESWGPPFSFLSRHDLKILFTFSSARRVHSVRHEWHCSVAKDTAPERCRRRVQLLKIEAMLCTFALRSGTGAIATQ